MMALEKKPAGAYLSDLLVGLGAIDPADDRIIQGVSIDSRTVKPGDLFLACRGECTSGSEYIDDAVRAGAVAVLIDSELRRPRGESVPLIPLRDLQHLAGFIVARFLGEPSTALRTIGVTGTNGKTSVAWYLAQLLSGLARRKTGLIGTLGYGYPGRLRPGPHTTPDPVVLQGLLAGFRDDGADTVVMEVSSQGLDQGRVAGVSFFAAVFTNLSQDHLDYHGSMAAYAEAKKQLFHAPGLKYAVINLDDEFGARLAEDLQGRVAFAGYRLVDDWEEDAGAFPVIQARITEATLDSQRMEVCSPWGEGCVRFKLPGRYNAYNLLACLATLCLLEVPFKEALQGLANVPQVPGRMEKFGGGQQPMIIVDYAHTPDALAKVLSSIRSTSRGRLICVFGCGGNRDVQKRAQMGAIAETYADQIIVTNDNPRMEDPQRIIDDILAGITQRQKLSIEPDRQTAITSAIQSSVAGDIVLVAGKGHESTQDIAGNKLPFSDRQVVCSVLGSTRGALL